MAYEASRPNLFDNVGGTVAPRTQIDVGGAIDALTGGATSLIHATMLRKQAQAEQANRAGELDLQRQRETREAGQQDWERQFKENEARRADLVAGIVPGHSIATPAPTMASVNMPAAKAPAPMTPIGKAMQGPATGGATTLPPPSLMGAAAPVTPATAPLPASTLQTTGVPESYDPERSQRMMGIKATMDAREQINAENRASAEARQRSAAAANAAVHDATNATNIKIAEMRAAAAKGGATGRALTPNAISQIVSMGAEAMVAAHGGHIEDLVDYLDTPNDPEAAKLKEAVGKLPIAWETYLRNARQKYLQRTEAPALRLQSGEGGMSPTEAVKTVQRTRDLVSGKPPAPKTPAPAATSPAPAGGASAQRQVPVPPDDYTKEELAAALNAGNGTDAAIKTYIEKQRASKKAPVKK